MSFARQEQQQQQEEEEALEQGEEGDRFYVLLKGRFGIKKAREVEVQVSAEWTLSEGQVLSYLKCLYENLDEVMWSKVPFGDTVREILERFKED